MHRPPPDPRHRTEPVRPSWRNILVSYATIAVLFLAFVSVSYPLLAVASIVALVGSAVVARRVAGLARCVRDCGGVSYDLAGRVRISVSRPRTDCPC
jgi:hypothetical protein